jgi:hypothetical protein
VALQDARLRLRLEAPVRFSVLHSTAECGRLHAEPVIIATRFEEEDARSLILR